MIHRIIEEEIIRRLKHNPGVAILGARQVGKTTLAKLIAKKHTPNSIYLDIENPNDRQKLEDAYTFLYSQQEKLIIIDEIQHRPDIFTMLRPLMDESRRNGQFLILGSASPQLIKKVSESLAGRIAYTYLTPFNLLEILPEYSQQEHWFRGGFPRALTAPNESALIDWLNNFITTYIERDIAHLFDINISSSLMRNFWQMLASANGAIWNAQNLSRSLGVSGPTIARYLDILEAAFIIRKLPAWFVNTKKRLVKSPKIYYRDSGILHRLNSIVNKDYLYGHIAAGASWEGYVIEQIMQLLPVDLNGFFYRTHEGAECDLVLVKGVKPKASIEIKISNAPQVSKGFFQCTEDLKTMKNYIITPESDLYPFKNAMVCSLDFFLKHYLKDI